MRLRDTEILYKRPNIEGEGRIELHPLGSNVRGNWCSTGACYTRVRAMTPAEGTHFLFNLAIHLIIRDGFNPMTVHNTFSEIEEYRSGLSCDAPIPEHLKKVFAVEVEENPACLVI